MVRVKRSFWSRAETAQDQTENLTASQISRSSLILIKVRVLFGNPWAYDIFKVNFND